MLAIRDLSLVSLLLVLTCALLSRAQDEEPIVIPPIVPDGTQVALLIVPGAYINYAQYRPLAAELQKASPYSLWISLIGPFALDLPAPEQCTRNIDRALELMIGMGMNTSYLLVAGHSLGGVVMQPWIMQNLPRTTAMILLASEEAPDFPGRNETGLSILEISGDLDGMHTIFHVEPTFRLLEEYAASDPSLLLSQPVVLVTDVNHMQFGSGAPPPVVQDDDVLSPLTEAEAQSRVALRIESFISVRVGEGPADHLQQSESVLIQAHYETKEILRSLQEMRDLTAMDGAAPYSPWVEESQFTIGAINNSSEGLVKVHDTYYPVEGDFTSSKPTVIAIDGIGYVNTSSHISQYVTSENTSTTADELAAKFKTKEALVEVLESINVEFLSGNRSCVDVNRAAVEACLQSASDVVRSRYANRSRPIILLEDDVKATGSAWINSQVYYNETEAGLIVQSTSLPTSLEAPETLAGMHYCKLMPPIRAMDYILLDSLRGTTP